MRKTGVTSKLSSIDYSFLKLIGQILHVANFEIRLYLLLNTISYI